MTPVAISVAEFCRISSLGKTTAFALIRDGRLVSTRVRGRTLISFDNAMALIAPNQLEDECREPSTLPDVSQKNILRLAIGEA